MPGLYLNREICGKKGIFQVTGCGGGERDLRLSYIVTCSSLFSIMCKLRETHHLEDMIAT